MESTLELSVSRVLSCLFHFHSCDWKVNADHARTPNGKVCVLNSWTGSLEVQYTQTQKKKRKLVTGDQYFSRQMILFLFLHSRQSTLRTVQDYLSILPVHHCWCPLCNAPSIHMVAECECRTHLTCSNTLIQSLRTMWTWSWTGTELVLILLWKHDLFLLVFFWRVGSAGGEGLSICVIIYYLSPSNNHQSQSIKSSLVLGM